VIIVRIIGGLGNQMFQYAIAKAMAKKNNDIFKFDITFYPKQTLRKYELNFFNIEENIATEEEVIKFRGKEDFLFKVKRKLGISFRRPKEYYKEKVITVFDKELWNKKGNLFIDGFWQNEDYFKDIRSEILTDFSLKNNISYNAQKHLINIKNSQSVSLHIRRGDYVENTHTNTVHGTCSLNYYKESSKYIYKNIENPSFYIFSDDINWCKDNFDFLKDKVFVDDTEDQFDDLELMRCCKHNIIANSTFSWWGAWLNENRDKIVICPKIWWAGKSSFHIAAKDWIKL